jgi:hypothetical protein
MTRQLRVFLKIVPLFSISTFVAALTVTAAFTMSISISRKFHLVGLLRIEGFEFTGNNYLGYAVSIGNIP